MGGPHDGNNKWNKIVTRWFPKDGKRKRGRLHQRYDDIKNYGRSNVEQSGLRKIGVE